MLTDAYLSESQETLGPLYGCQLDFSAFEIQEDLGDLMLEGHSYGGYVISYGTSDDSHYYLLADETYQSELSAGYGDIWWGPNEPEWSPGQSRLLNRLQRLQWSSFAGGISRLPPIGSPLDRYPGDGAMLGPEPENGIDGRNDDERLYIKDSRAWHEQMGYPGWFATHSAEYSHVACFLYPIKTDREWSLHDGPIEKITHLFDDPRQPQFLGDLSQALKVFDEFTGQDLASRCTMTHHRPKMIKLDFGGGRFLQFFRDTAEDRTYGTGLKCSGGSSESVDDHSCVAASYTLTLDDGTSPGRISYESLLKAIASWPVATSGA